MNLCEKSGCLTNVNKSFSLFQKDGYFRNVKNFLSYKNIVAGCFDHLNLLRTQVHAERWLPADEPQTIARGGTIKKARTP
jgi:hypothetical protein